MSSKSKGREKINSAVLCVSGGVINAHSEYANYVYMLNKSGISGISKSSLALSHSVTLKRMGLPIAKDTSPAASSTLPAASSTLPAASSTPPAGFSTLPAADTSNPDAFSSSLLTPKLKSVADFSNEGLKIIEEKKFGENLTYYETFVVALHMYVIFKDNRDQLTTALNQNVPRMFPTENRTQILGTIKPATCPEQVLIFSFLSCVLSAKQARQSRDIYQSAFTALSKLIKERHVNFNARQFATFVQQKTDPNQTLLYFPTPGDLDDLGISCSATVAKI